ncbi:MAG: zinc ribbon domain-containing protein [Methanobacteriota archaeon]|nr:MAG: zinc ribbon domain-containing protein [Euryarchaeota archaeon]TLZ74218.1 MAG: zinc ribbon domain-containing protein [Euryarchaeota archaeon]
MADDVTVAVILVLVAIGAATFLETRFLRRKMKNRRVRTAKRDEEVQDESHNAIVTTKAILTSLERQGIRSEEATGWLREAEMAKGRRNYRVAIELTGKAKARLLSLKSAQAAKGDLAKLDSMSSTGSTTEMTTKEVLTKDVPPNLLQSKFSIGVAETALEQGRVAGRDTTQATQLLEAAKARFDAKDYAGALSIARLSKRASNGEVVDASIPPPVAAPPPTTSVGPTCSSCGAALEPDDVFCRKCGTRVVSTACVSCGASLRADDAFCRKCGTPVSG